MTTKNIINTLHADPAWQEGEFHQAILNFGYDEWQKRGNDWDFEDMVDYVQDTLGHLARWLFIMGKYDQQVCNGGHRQWINNGYAGLDEADLPPSFTAQDLPFLCDLVRDSRRFLSNDLIGRYIGIFDNMEKLNRKRVSWSDDDDDYFDNFDELDNYYYTVNEQFMKELNAYVATKF